MAAATAATVAAARADGNDIEMKQSRETMGATSNMTIERVARCDARLRRDRNKQLQKGDGEG